MSSITLQSIRVAQPDVEHAGVGHSFRYTDPVVVGKQAMLPTEDIDRTSDWLPAEVTAQQHSAPHPFGLRAFRTGAPTRNANRVGWDVAARTDAIRPSHPSL